MRKYAIAIGTLVIITVLIAALEIHFSAQRPASTLAESASTSPAALQQFTPRQAPAGDAEYHNVKYGFSLFYPDSLAVAEHDMGGGAMTITFQNVQTAQGFQIFIVPYAQPQVTNQRFHEDEPSGVRDDLKSGLVDGATAASFYSVDAQLGDTYEVWIVHGGYLYEVTTLKPLDTWLSQIMASWQFL